MIEARDVKHTIYEVPLMLHEEGLDDLVCELLHLEAPPPDLTNWRKFVERVVSPKKQVKIAVVGKYIDLQDAYKSIYESLTHAAASQDCGIDLKLIDAESLQDGVDGQLKDVAGVLIPGGFGERGVEGKIRRRVSRAKTSALPRSLPRHAGRDDRVRAQRLRPREGQQHRVRRRTRRIRSFACSRSSAT